YEEIRRNISEKVKFWCKHCESDIYVEGKRINEPFELRHPYVVEHQVPGTEVLVAPSEEEKPFYGFYNRGLTLVERGMTADPAASHIPGVQFKIKSRYLEHTLTRDNVLVDENFAKAMAILRQVVDGPFRKRLFEEAFKGEDDAVFGYLVQRLKGLPEDLHGKPLILTVDGARLSLKQIRAAAQKTGEILYDDRETPISRALKAQGFRVIRWRGPEAEPGLGKLLRHLADKKGQLLQASATFAQPSLVNNLPRPHAELLEQAGRILRRAGSPYRAIYPGSFQYDGSCIADRTYVLQKKPGSLLRRDGEKKTWWTGLFGGAPQDLVVNVEDELVAQNFRLAQKFPTLAPYLLATTFTMCDGLDAVTVTRMIEAAMAERGDLPKAAR
ncbi:MAG: hypothetical protein AB1758_31705, partial [Candidatus Eremiobacterota bacterium]